MSAAEARPGLQAERTVLAWSRTALALFVNALLALRSGLEHDERALLVLGIALLAASAAGTAIGALRRHQLAQPGRDPRPQAALLLATVAVTWLACASALAGVALHVLALP